MKNSASHWKINALGAIIFLLVRTLSGLRLNEIKGIFARRRSGSLTGFRPK